MPRGFSPGWTISGTLRPPGSKSLAIRALLSAALARGRTRVSALPEGEDVQACLGVLGAAGIEFVRHSATEIEVTGQSPGDGNHWRPGAALECGESGTLARLSTAILGFCAVPGQAHRIEVSGSLRRRSSEPLLDALASAGVRIERLGGSGSWPLELWAAPADQTILLQSPVSSQELSGLLMALSSHGSTARGRSILVMGGLPSEPYVEMTAAVLAEFGARISHEGAEWLVEGPLIAPKSAFEVETDASGAAVALAAGCLSGGEVRVPGFHEKSWQGDLAIVEDLRAFGCEVDRCGSELLARGQPTRAAELDLSATPDLAPVLAAVAGAHALRSGARARPSRLRGLETLNAKESRRIEVLAGGLRALGLEVRETDESLEIGASAGLGSDARTRLVLDPHGDHRMAFAFALLGLVRPNLFVSDPSCVKKSWPSFWETLCPRS